MPWDIQQEGETGDVVFTPTHDLAGISSEGLLKQRVIMRCRVRRGTWLYDLDGNFGSNLLQVTRSPSRSQIDATRAAVIEALEPMSDEIKIHSVDVVKKDESAIQVTVNFSAISTDPDVPTVESLSTVEFDAISVTIPQV